MRNEKSSTCQYFIYKDDKFYCLSHFEAIFNAKWKFVFLIRHIEMVKTSASVAPHSPDSLSGAVAGQV